MVSLSCRNRSKLEAFAFRVREAFVNLSISLAMSTTEEAAGSARPTVAPELVETIRAVVGELLDQRRTADRGGVPPDAAGSSGAGPSRAPIEGG